MCGLTGIRAKSNLNLSSVVNLMTSRLTHRGPDASGCWIDDATSIGLGHRRLSIIDLSPAGAQPMHSTCGQYAIAFNGEIYNYQSLRSELTDLHPTHAWRGKSDTEVILACVTHLGVETTLTKLDGMFAIAIYDKRTSNIYLARDRMGEKPLYFGYVGEKFAFASELKALKTLPGWTNKIDKNALTAYFRYSYIPSPLSIYQGISKLLPGHYLVLSTQDFAAMHVPDSKPYWQLDDAIASSKLHPFAGTQKDATDELESLLMQTIEKQMISDVQIGAFLSGGIDSSTVVALMQAISKTPVETFTIGFDDAAFNEAENAKAISRHIGTSHHELYVSAKDSLAVVPTLPELYDEPFADPSQIPTYLVAKLARTKVAVSLSGDGGDELFCGYNRYTWMYKIWGAMSPLPMNLRHSLGKLAQSVPQTVVEKGYAALRHLLPRRLQFSNASDKWTKAAGLIGQSDSGALYTQIISSWQTPSTVVLAGVEAESIFKLNELRSHRLDLGEQMMRLDALTYLPDDILVKLDRASMGVSLESRVPLLDHHVVEFAWRLPMSMKLRNGTTKWILRQLLYRHVPRALVERPKMGFGVPIDRWLRNELKEWAEMLLDPNKMRQQGYLNVDLVRATWNEHQSGQRNWQYPLWTVLMFQAWLAKQEQPT